MIGRPEWFQKRKYGGWGVTPKTWQGWAYMLFVVLPVYAMQYIGVSGGSMFIFTLAWIVVVILDLIDVMQKLKMDEREKQIEAIAERNSAWAMVAVLTLGIGYQVASSVVRQSVSVDPFLVTALMAGAIVKAASNIHLERKM